MRPKRLARGDAIRVYRNGELVLKWGPNRYLLSRGRAALECDPLVLSAGHSPQRTLALEVDEGTVTVAGGRAPAPVVTPEAVTVTDRAHTAFYVHRWIGGRTSVVTHNYMLTLADRRLQRLRLDVRPHQTGLMDKDGLRLDSYPFALSPLERPVRASDDLVPFWDDGLACSVGCHAPGATPGWPLKPFNRQHAIRSAINELRPSGFHEAIDIEAYDGQQVYAMSSGRADVIVPSGSEERVQVGQFIYWHLNLEVRTGSWVWAYKTPLGTVQAGFRHVALSEVSGSTFLNPLRPGGRNLSPWSDTEGPVIGKPQIYSDGRAIVEAFDPQSYVVDLLYETPVLAPAALAWRLYDSGGHALTGLEWALRGTRVLPYSELSSVFAPGAENPGFWCFIKQRVCKPTWRYWLAGGLTERLPLASLDSGRYRLTVYAWDWAGNTSALDYWFDRAQLAPVSPRHGTLIPRPDVQ